MRVIVFSMVLTALLIAAASIPAAIISKPVIFKSNKTEQPTGFTNISFRPVGRLFYIETLQFNTISEGCLKAGAGNITTLSKRYEV